jgi:FHA domain
VSHANNEKTTDKVTADATSAFCAEFLGELDTSTDAVVEAGVWEKGSPSGSAMLVVKRGPDDVSVSRRHAEFRRENGDYVVVDTGSLNATYVNRKPVESVALANGDEIQMGKFRLVFLTRPTTH